MVNGNLAHMMVGMATATGKTEMTRDVDPAGVNTAALLQRTGLTLDAGQVVFGFGGNDGDCSTYRGRVVAVPETGGTPKIFTVDAAAGDSEGAVWMGGAAPSVDGRGHVWVSVGNGSVRSDAHAYDDSDSVLELSSSLRLVQFFAPSAWASNNAQDLDLLTEPVLLSDGQVLAAGKTQAAYLLDGAHLGGIGGQQATLGSACSEDIDGGNATVGMTVYLPCVSGIVAVQAEKSPAALHLLWRSPAGGGPPIVAAGLVWSIGQNGTLYGLSPATGQVRQQVRSLRRPIIFRLPASATVSCWFRRRIRLSRSPRGRPARRPPSPRRLRVPLPLPFRAGRPKRPEVRPGLRALSPPSWSAAWCSSR